MATPPVNEVLKVSYDKHSDESIEISNSALRDSVMVLRAINHALRQNMIRLIDENGKMTVTEIYVKLRLEQSVASQHLAILRNAGFLNTTRKGKYILYSVNKERLLEVKMFMEHIISPEDNG